MRAVSIVCVCVCACSDLILGAPVSSVVGSSAQVQSLAARRSTSFPCGGRRGLGCLRDLDALGGHRFLLVLELQLLLPAVPGCPVFVAVTNGNRG